jgi:hypothetical protein
MLLSLPGPSCLARAALSAVDVKAPNAARSVIVGGGASGADILTASSISPAARRAARRHPDRQRRRSYPADWSG